jgi:LacI family transcriptional regulator
VPTVVMDCGKTHFPADKIQDNSYLGGYLATQYLIKKGHRKIGCITGPLNKPMAEKRWAGYQKAMQDAGLIINPAWLEDGHFECEGGQQAFEKILSRGTLPSALFVCNDMMALGVINSASKNGISIPGDLSIIGYDDIKIARFFTPSLTTIHQPKFNLGRKAFDTLLDKIKSKRENDLEIKLEPTLIERDSVKQIG